MYIAQWICLLAGILHCTSGLHYYCCSDDSKDLGDESCATHSQVWQSQSDFGGRGSHGTLISCVSSFPPQHNANSALSGVEVLSYQVKSPNKPSHTSRKHEIYWINISYVSSKKIINKYLNMKTCSTQANDSTNKFKLVLNGK